ncbi:MAG: hypothetical protein R3C30_12040 [Hyphomonadaceae bacterium]
MTADRGRNYARTGDAEKAMSMDGFFADEISVETAPSPEDPYEVRAAWAREAVSQAMTQTTEQRSARVSLPEDVRPSHFWEVEYQSALVDPVAYARSMRETGRAPN